MAPPLLLLLLGLLYLLLSGTLALLRREGLSARPAIEGLVFCLVVAGLVAFAGLPVNPIVFLGLLYLLTMRVRLLVDVGNLLARRGNYAAAESAYRWGLRMWPDETGRLMVQLNQGVLDIHTGRLDSAIETLRQVLAHSRSGYLGIKHECGAHYNLGVAYQKQGLDSQAAQQFQAVLETWPASEYTRYARIALERRKGKDMAGE